MIKHNNHSGLQNDIMKTSGSTSHSEYLKIGGRTWQRPDTNINWS